MLRLIIVFAELEREMIAERTTATMRDRAERGLWNGGYILGYRSDPKEKGKLIVDPEWASIIRTHFFDAFETLGSATKVLKELNRLGIKKPVWDSRSGRTHGGRPFTKEQVLGVLRNPIYLGQIRWGDVEQHQCHEPIISDPQFERVQQRLSETTRNRCNFRYSRGRTYLLRSLIRCACGAMMTPQGTQGRPRTYHYYVCSKQSHEGGKVSCRSPRVPAEPIEKAVLSRLRELGSVEGARMKIIQEAMTELDSNGQHQRAEEETLRRQLNRVKSEVGQLIQVLKANGAAAFPSIQQELASLQAEEQDLSNQIGKLAEKRGVIDQCHEHAKRFLESWADIDRLFDAAEEDDLRLIIQHFVEVIELTSDGSSNTGSYALRLFPDVSSALNEIGLVPGHSQGKSVLTNKDTVLEAVEKAPRTQRSS